MKNILIPVLLLVMSFNSFAQIKGVTETGEEVILYNNGTWKYVNDSITIKNEVKLNEKEFSKEKTSTFLVKSKVLNLGVWINPVKWSFEKGESTESREYKFQEKEESLYGMLITEKLKVPLETLISIAIENGKKAAPDLKVIKQEYRIVNGVKVMMMQMSGTIQGISFVYYGYYYSNESGSVQFLAYTSQDLLNNYSDDIEELLNGFVVIKD
jgi:hypothetical protein